MSRPALSSPTASPGSPGARATRSGPRRGRRSAGGSPERQNPSKRPKVRQHRRPRLLRLFSSRTRQREPGKRGHALETIPKRSVDSEVFAHRGADRTVFPLQVDALDRTIVIHPGSRWLRVGLASQVAPVSVPNVIARKRRNTRTAAGAETPLGTASRAAPRDASDATGAAGTAAPTNGAAASADRPSRQDVSMQEDGEARGSEDELNDDSDNKAGGDVDPLTAKITSLRGDLRARMRVYKLRGQGNGNSQAANFNATVQPEAMGEDFEGDFDWTTGEADVWTGIDVRPGAGSR